jgi:hydroxymethylglutaryl-CoA reductase
MHLGLYYVTTHAWGINYLPVDICFEYICPLLHRLHNEKYCILVDTNDLTVGKKIAFTAKIRAYIKNCCFLGIGPKEIFHEILTDARTRKVQSYGRTLKRIR